MHRTPPLQAPIRAHHMQTRQFVRTTCRRADHHAQARQFTRTRPVCANWRAPDVELLLRQLEAAEGQQPPEDGNSRFTDGVFTLEFLCLLSAQLLISSHLCELCFVVGLTCLTFLRHLCPCLFFVCATL